MKVGERALAIGVGIFLISLWLSYLLGMWWTYLEIRMGMPFSELVMAPAVMGLLGAILIGVSYFYLVQIHEQLFAGGGVKNT